ncbi:MAG: helix-turn-helix transcriptional regulator [Bacteroidota bacterium]
MIERIKLIMTTKNLVPSAFADVIGVQRSAISHLLSGRNNPSLEFVQKILRKYPEISSEWLLTGKGEMNKKVLSLFDFDEETKDKTEAEPGMQEIKELLPKEEIELTPIQPTVQKEKDLHIKVEKEEKPEPKRQETCNEDIINAFMTGKKINKIVFFYADKSFSEFYPEN